MSSASLTHPLLLQLVDRCLQALDASDPRADVVAALEEFVAEPQPLLGQLGAPDHTEGGPTGIDETFYEADDLVVMICHTRPGLDQPPHDHRFETIIGAYDGVEHHRFFITTPVGVQAAGSRDLCAGEVLALAPDAIHAISATGDQWCSAIHVYLGNINAVERSLFHPENLTENPLTMERYIEWCRQGEPV